MADLDPGYSANLPPAARAGLGFVRRLIFILGILIFLLGLALLGLESYLWQQMGHWPSFSLIDGIRLFMVFAVSDVGTYSFEKWLAGWVWLGKILDELPLGISVTGIGALLMACGLRRQT